MYEKHLQLLKITGGAGQHPGINSIDKILFFVTLQPKVGQHAGMSPQVQCK
jgi:hypothetical protein